MVNYEQTINTSYFQMCFLKYKPHYSLEICDIQTIISHLELSTYFLLNIFSSPLQKPILFPAFFSSLHFNKYQRSKWKVCALLFIFCSDAHYTSSHRQQKYFFIDALLHIFKNVSEENICYIFWVKTKLTRKNFPFICPHSLFFLFDL